MQSVKYIRGRHTGFGFFRLTNVQHDKFYVHNNTFYSVISKITMNLCLKKFKSEK